jgi:hypothetical protein
MRSLPRVLFFVRIPPKMERDAHVQQLSAPGAAAPAGYDSGGGLDEADKVIQIDPLVYQPVLSETACQ